MKLGPGHIEVKERELPPGWISSRIADSCQILQGGRLGLTKEKNYLSSGIPAFSAAGQDGFVEVVEFEQDGVVLSAIGANCGRCFFASGKWTTLANVQAIIPDPRKLSARFLFHRANIENFWSRSGSAQPFIKPTDVHSSWLAHPRCVSEQLKIAQVIDVVDRAIEQTEALLAKQQRIKTGLLHDLLTCGLDVQGRLRDPSTSPKPSRVGNIPNEWKPSTVGAECDQVCVGIVIRPTQYYAEQGPIALRSLNVQSGFFDLSNVVRIRPETNETLSKSRLKAGDVVTVRTGTPGTSAVVTPELEGANCIDLVISRPGRRLRSGFLALWMNSAFGKEHVLRNQGGLAQQHFNVGDMKLLPIPLPDPTEQDAIVVRGETITKTYDELQETYSKLKRLKSGLMHDLLTGRVPVTPLLTNSKAGISS